MISGIDDLFDDDFIKQNETNEQTTYSVRELEARLEIIDKFIKYKLLKKKKFDFKLNYLSK